MRMTRTKTVIPEVRRRTVLGCAALFLLASVLLALPAGAARPDKKPLAPYALIFGTVWSPQNLPAAGVKVKIRRATDKKAKWELISDRRGEFAQRVPAGAADYVIWADVKTPKGQPRPEAKVHVDNEERVDVSLHLTE